MSIPAKLVFLCVGALAIRAADAPPHGDEPIVLGEFAVTDARVGALQISLPRAGLHLPGPNLGAELSAIPGVYGHARAADAMEPNIRGLGFDRVATTLNGIPLVNASPERSNSPVVILGPVAAADVVVSKALPSVTLGPVTSAGQIALSTSGNGGSPAASPEGVNGKFHATFRGDRDAVMTRAQVTATHGGWTGSATFFHNDLGDYRSADGRHVSARLEESGASASLGWRNANHEARLDVLQRRLRRQTALALPLDGKNTETQILTFVDRWTFDRGALRAIEWRAGGSWTDPFITNEDRTVPTRTSAVATARTGAIGVLTAWAPTAAATLSLGGDASRQIRRAVRTTPAGQDFIWPDANYEDVGAFAEWQQPFAAGWKLRLGTRVDRVTSDARDADRLALGRPLREQFERYNGPAASVVKREDVVGAANVLLNWTDRRDLGAFFGIGWSEQPAPVMERYRAFLNALGGDGRGGNAVEIGNPALHAERKMAFETGATWKRPRADFEATLYYYRIDDFILRTRIGVTQPPVAPMVVFGYRNTEAELYGAEFGAALKPVAAWRVPLKFAISEGRDCRAHVGLSEIPPWEATAAVRHRGSFRALPFTSEVGMRIVGPRDNPAPFDNPILGNTAGFSVVHFRFALPLGAHLQLEAGVENLFNRSYTEYLTPVVGPSKPATGDLLPGDRVPAPGRSTWISATWKF